MERDRNTLADVARRVGVKFTTHAGEQLKSHKRRLSHCTRAGAGLARFIGLLGYSQKMGPGAAPVRARVAYSVC